MTMPLFFYLEEANRFCPDLSLSSNQSASVHHRCYLGYFGNPCHASFWLWHLQGSTEFTKGH